MRLAGIAVIALGLASPLVLRPPDILVSDEARLIGRSLQLATRRPSDDFIFLVDSQPVIVAWGYEADAVASLQG